MENKPKKALLCHQKFAKLVSISGRTQEEIAEELDLSDRYVRTLKTKNKNISVSLANKISQIFGCSIESLLTIGQYLPDVPQDISLYSINGIILESILDHLEQFTTRNIAIKTRLTQPLPLIWLNRSYIKQVIVNCLRNSYASILTKNPPDKQIFVCTRLAPNQQKVEILLYDNGIGITPEQQANHFKKPVIAKLCNNIIEARISMAIIKQHGGNMTISGEPGKGCCVHIELPTPDMQQSSDDNSDTEILKLTDKSS